MLVSLMTSNNCGITLYNNSLTSGLSTVLLYILLLFIVYFAYFVLLYILLFIVSCALCIYI